MRRLIRNIEGEPRPLILHRQLHRLRVIDQHVRFAACKVLGLQYRWPRYMYAQRTPEQEAHLRLACESFLGIPSTDPRVARYYFEVGRWILLASPGVSDERKRDLLAEGPRCSHDDMAYASSLPLTGWDASTADAARDARVRLLSQVRDIAEQLSVEGAAAAFLDPVAHVAA